MPAMANITVKKSNGSTDIVYVAAAPSAGENIPSVWQATAESAVIGHRPKLTFSFRSNAAKTGRVFQGKLTYPSYYTNTEGVAVLIATSEIRFEGTLPSNIDAAAKKEAIYQAGNLLVSTLLRSAMEEEYAPS